MVAVLTDRDLLLYPSLPESKESVNSPAKSHPLITTRFGSPGELLLWSVPPAPFMFGSVGRAEEIRV